MKKIQFNSIQVNIPHPLQACMYVKHMTKVKLWRAL
jgi:hypothetical protein